MGLLFIALSLAACADWDSLRWVEKVKLPDGRVITLDRYQHFGGRVSEEGTPTVTDYWFETVHPDTGEKVRWESRGNVSTVAIFVAETKFYLLTTPTFGGHDREFGCPRPPFLLYRFEGKQWTDVSLSEAPLKQLTANMTVDPKRSRAYILGKEKKLSTEDVKKTVLMDNRMSSAIDFAGMPQRFVCR
jgi:hypothetical protein